LRVVTCSLSKRERNIIKVQCTDQKKREGTGEVKERVEFNKKVFLGQLMGRNRRRCLLRDTRGKGSKVSAYNTNGRRSLQGKKVGDRLDDGGWRRNVQRHLRREGKEKKGAGWQIGGSNLERRHGSHRCVMTVGEPRELQKTEWRDMSGTWGKNVRIRSA